MKLRPVERAAFEGKEFIDSKWHLETKTYQLTDSETKMELERIIESKGLRS